MPEHVRSSALALSHTQVTGGCVTERIPWYLKARFTRRPHKGTLTILAALLGVHSGLHNELIRFQRSPYPGKVVQLGGHGR